MERDGKYNCLVSSLTGETMEIVINELQNILERKCVVEAKKE